jgi:Peptidase propeptide and YPEB domain
MSNPSALSDPASHQQKGSPMKRSKFLLAIPLVLALGATGAVAQTSTTTEKAAPEAGANSFTEAQAKDRIEKAGFAQVSGLRKDDQGIWRASATKGGTQVNVSLDFRGNVTTQ